MSKQRRSVRLAVLDEGEAALLRAALERHLEEAELLRDREALARWLQQLGDAQLESDRSNVRNLFDGAPHDSTAIERVFEHWARTMNRPRARLDGKRSRLIEKRLREYDEPTLIRAIDGCAASDFHQGGNDEGRKYNGLDLVLRDAERIETFCELAERPPAPRPTSRPSFGAASRQAQTRAALDDFVNAEPKK